MSNRTIVELNHDYCPRDDARELIKWALQMRYYMGNAEPAYLPNGVTFFHYRHHSEPCPLKPQPRRTGSDKHGYSMWLDKRADELIAKAQPALPPRSE